MIRRWPLSIELVVGRYWSVSDGLRDPNRFQCSQEAREVPERLRVLGRNPIRVEVHDIVPNPANVVQRLDEVLSVQRQIDPSPTTWLFKEADIFSKVQVIYRVDNPIFIGRISNAREIISRKV